MSESDQTRVMGATSMPMDRTMVAPAGGNATVQMPAGGGANDAFRTQMGGVATCPVCQASTPSMETYCGECGFLLASTPAEAIVTPVEEAPIAELVDVVSGRRFRLRAGVNTLGRMGTDVVSADGTVSRNHATLTVKDDQVVIEDLGSSNGTKVGDRRIGANEPATATHGTALRFGNWRLMLEVAAAGAAGNADRTIVTAPEDRTVIAPPAIESAETEAATESVAPVSTEPPVARLECLSGPAGTIDIPEGVITIGRRSGNTVTVANDTYVSGRHAELRTDHTGTYLTDLGSTNGTVVNGERLDANEPQLLLDGDEVQLGQSKFKFALLELEDEIAEESAPASVEDSATPEA